MYFICFKIFIDKFLATIFQIMPNYFITSLSLSYQFNKNLQFLQTINLIEG